MHFSCMSSFKSVHYRRVCELQGAYQLDVLLPEPAGKQAALRDNCDHLFLELLQRARAPRTLSRAQASLLRHSSSRHSQK